MVNVQTGDAAVDLAVDTIKIGKQGLLFANTKKSAEKAAEDIAKKLKENIKLRELSEKILNALAKPTHQCERLAKCVSKGIAFHHAGLHSKQKDIIEENFKNGKIKIICATPTLAAGVDLPAFRAILKDLRRYGIHGYNFIPVLEYMQMAGRAGRPKFDKYGEAIIIAKSEAEKENLREKYINGKPEEIYSKLAVEPVLRTYLLSLIAADFVNDKNSIMDFFSRTFWAYQYKDMVKLSAIIERMLGLLEEWEFIKSSNISSDFQSAADIGNEKYKATLIGKRVAELYIDPYTAHYLVECLREAMSKETNEYSFLQMLSHTLEMRPLLKARVKEYDKMQEFLVEQSESLLEEEPSMYEPEYDDFLNSIKTAMFFKDWVDEKDEEFLLEEYNIRPGETRAKLAIIDWLIYTSEELCRIIQFKKLIRELVKLRLRLKYGVKVELLPLLKLSGVGRARARAMFKNGIRDIKDVKAVDYMKLMQILGGKVAADIKEQVGQKVNVIPERKRKGQISLKDY